jgi:hypothetical protein
MQAIIKLFTEWTKSTDREKTGLEREKTTSDGAIEVNSSDGKVIYFKGL